MSAIEPGPNKGGHNDPPDTPRPASTPAPQPRKIGGAAMANLLTWMENVPTDSQLDAPVPALSGKTGRQLLGEIDSEAVALPDARIHVNAPGGGIAYESLEDLGRQVLPLLPELLKLALPGDDLEIAVSRLLASRRPLLSLEEHNRQARSRSQPKGPRLNGIACPKCGEELADAEPFICLNSLPPQANIYCPSCKYRGSRVL